MKEILILDVLNKCDGKLVVGNKNEICNNFKTDTRKIEKGDTFVGIKGENFDGNLLYEKALENGALTCILQNVDIDKDILDKYNDRNIVIVEDTIKAVGILAKYKRSLFDIPVVGITGSGGKTSTKDIVASVVSKKYNVLKTLGIVNTFQFVVINNTQKVMPNTPAIPATIILTRIVNQSSTNILRATMNTMSVKIQIIIFATNINYLPFQNSFCFY